MNRNPRKPSRVPQFPDETNNSNSNSHPPSLPLKPNTQQISTKEQLTNTPLPTRTRLALRRHTILHPCAIARAHAGRPRTARAPRARDRVLRHGFLARAGQRGLFPARAFGLAGAEAGAVGAAAAGFWEGHCAGW